MQVTPSEVVQAIESLIGAKPTDVDDRRLRHQYMPEVKSILALLDDVPTALIDLPFATYLEFALCRSVLAATLARWQVGDSGLVVRDVRGKDAVERIRLIMKQCRDTLPPKQPVLTVCR